MNSKEVRSTFIKYFTSSPRDHSQITPAPVVLQGDPTTLFNSSGMQQLTPYLMGKKHPKGKRLVNSQPSVRADNLNNDINEVGDNRHLTLFEMLGNWSLGDYFKTQQLSWFLDFLTKHLNLEKDRIWVTVFEGVDSVEKDNQSIIIWKKLGIPSSKIFEYPAKKNWWSTSGVPEQMPIGQIGGPDSEVFYEFPNIKHDKSYGKVCHPNCDCGRFMEIGNSVFIQYKKTGEGKLEELPQKNVDFGGGLERLVAATNNNTDIFQTDLFSKIIEKIENISGIKYEGEKTKKYMRMIADHVKASVFIADAGIDPANKLHGYVLRKLIRRSVLKMRNLTDKIDPQKMLRILDTVYDTYEDVYLSSRPKPEVHSVIEKEISKFSQTLEKGLKEVEKINTINPKKAFDLYQSYGFPFELTKEIFIEKGQSIDEKEYKEFVEKHRHSSKSVSAGVFKGGLADHSEEVVKLHTATHLLQSQLRKTLGDQVLQRGQNITKERSRFDFSYDKKLTDDQVKKIESTINEKINQDLPVKQVMLSKYEAKKTGAIGLFEDKYSEKVSVYFVGESLSSAESKEFCGGPHVSSTAKIGKIKILKQKKIGANLIRVYLTLSDEK